MFVVVYLFGGGPLLRVFDLSVRRVGSGGAVGAVVRLRMGWHAVVRAVVRSERPVRIGV